MAVGWSPLGSYSDTSLKATPPSDFSGRSGRCGMNCGRLPETSGCVAIIGCSASTWRARSERSCGLARMALSDAVMLSMLREGGADLAQRGEGGGRGGQERRLRRLGEALRGGTPRLRRAAGALYGRRGRLAGFAARGAGARGGVAGGSGAGRAERSREDGASADLGGRGMGRYMARERRGGKLGAGTLTYLLTNGGNRLGATSGTAMHIGSDLAAVVIYTAD